MKVTFVCGEDWEGLFLNGECVLQNHHLEARQVLKALGIKFDRLEADDVWLNEEGYFPDNLKDVKLQ